MNISGSLYWTLRNLDSGYTIDDLPIRNVEKFVKENLDFDKTDSFRQFDKNLPYPIKVDLDTGEFSCLE